MLNTFAGSLTSSPFFLVRLTAAEPLQQGGLKPLTTTPGAEEAERSPEFWMELISGSLGAFLSGAQTALRHLCLLEP